ncbi:sugar ABC transporter permease [Salipaludibacillus neizhouensis]|uniref:Sugar ABC transporter permease n=2 Tax=Salipaludibacillus neizhouensis TaxID=885475 RepID=A0A3A9K5Z9_9BACI|nr:sugar ABC transporter permease [Salipaludibacillus neizhouensis]
MVLLKGRTFIALILLLIIFSMLIPNFLSPHNLILISKHVVLYAILGIGMTFVIVTGGIDLSVGSIVGLSAMFAGGLIYEGLVLDPFGVTIYFSIINVILLTLIFGALIGSVNGFMITKFNVPPFIATLGMLYVARGFALLRSEGSTFPNLSGTAEHGNTGFSILGSGTVLGLPLSIWIMVLIGVIAAYIFKKTPFGWHIFAVGGNEKAADISGVRVNKVKLLVYMVSGLCAAMVGLIVASQLGAAHPATGETWELNAIAATVLGGTSLAGGRGSIGGTIMGAFVIGVLSDGMVMMGVSEFWQMVITGGVIVLAVIVDQFQGRLQHKMALEQRV